MPRLKRWVLPLLYALLTSVHTTADIAQDAPGWTDKQRAAAVQALRPEKENTSNEVHLLESLGRPPYATEANKPESGRIKIAFTDEQGAPLPLNGWVSYETDDGRNHGCLIMRYGAGIAAVTEGRTEIVLHGRERQAIVYTEGLPGYALAKEDTYRRKFPYISLTLPEGETIRSETLPLEPAGAIRWRVLNEQADPETEEIRYWLFTPPYSTGGGDARPPYERFFIRPARFNAPYRLVLQKGVRFANSSPAPLSISAPVADLTIAFQPGTTVSGRLLDADKRPLAGAHLRLGYQMLEPQPQMLENVAEIMTGPDGVFSFESINLDMPNSYWLVFDPTDKAEVQHKALPAHRIALTTQTPLPVEMKLPPVHVARGRLLDDKTGEPLVGVQVWAHVHERFSKTGRPDWLPVFQIPAVAPTDESGRFQFNNLPAGVYNFHLSKGRIQQSGDSVRVPDNPVAGREDIDLLRVPQSGTDNPQTFWVGEA